jgi:Electron transfer DM13
MEMNPMKLKPWIFGTIAAVVALTIACSNQAAPQRTEAVPQPSVISNSPAPKSPSDSPQSTAPQSGQFVTAEHPTQGTAQIVTENGKRYLILDSAFKTDAGPDLFVLLHRENMPRTYDAQSYLSLGALQQTSGEQRYAIPDGVDLGSFQSAVIWCRQFNATFGYAVFGS